MANLQVKDIDDNLYLRLKQLAVNEKRSLSQEIITILEKYLSTPDVFDRNPTGKFLELAGSWKDARKSEEIINEIHAHRINSTRFGSDNELFD